MRILLGDEKKKLALKKNKLNLYQIRIDYWKKEKYTEVHENETIEKEVYKYKTSEIMDKYDIKSHNELLYLLSFYDKRDAYICKYCEQECFDIPMRKGIASINCGHRGLCVNCNKVFINGSVDTQTCQECYQNKKAKKVKQEKPDSSYQQRNHDYQPVKNSKFITCHRVNGNKYDDKIIYVRLCEIKSVDDINDNQCTFNTYKDHKYFTFLSANEVVTLVNNDK